MEPLLYDAIIIGSGVAGVSAALYLKRAGKEVLILDKGPVGGELNNILKIENYVGFESITGPELALTLKNQIDKAGIKYEYGQVTQIDGSETKRIVTDIKEYQTKNIIIATGRRPKLGLDEGKYKNVSYCALCDGTLYKDKTVAVLGRTNSAVKAALYLSAICHKVYLINSQDTFAINENELANLKEKTNIELVLNETVKQIMGDKIMTEIVLKSQTLSLDGLFIYIGNIPNTEFLEGSNILLDNGYIVVNNKMETNIKGIYACGDVIKKSLYQIATSVGEGAIAGTQIN